MLAPTRLWVSRLVPRAKTALTVLVARSFARPAILDITSLLLAKAPV